MGGRCSAWAAAERPVGWGSGPEPAGDRTRPPFGRRCRFGLARRTAADLVPVRRSTIAALARIRLDRHTARHAHPPHRAPRRPVPAPGRRRVRRPLAPPAAAADFPAKDSGYHNYAEMVAAIQTRPSPTTRPSSSRSRSARATRAATSGRPRSPTTSRPTRTSPRSCSTGCTTPASTSRVEQTLAILRWLTDGYGSDDRITEHRRHARDLDRLHGQPRRRRVRPDRHRRTAPGARTASPTRARPPSAPTSTATTATTGAAAAARRARSRLRDLPRPVGRSPRPETRAVRDFIDSRRRRRAAADQDRHHVPHRRRAGPVAVRLHDGRRPVRHDRRRPRRARRDRQEAWPTTNGYTPMQSSDLYITDGDEIDWAYGVAPDLHVHLRDVPEPQPGQLDRALLPARRGHRPRDRTATRPRSCYLIEARRLPVRA